MLYICLPGISCIHVLLLCLNALGIKMSSRYKFLSLSIEIFDSLLCICEMMESYTSEGYRYQLPFPLCLLPMYLVCHHIRFMKLVFLEQCIDTSHVLPQVFRSHLSFHILQPKVKVFLGCRIMPHISVYFIINYTQVPLIPSLNCRSWFASISFCDFSAEWASSASHCSSRVAIRACTSASRPGHC